MSILKHPNFEGVYWIADRAGRRLATKNLAPGSNVYGEEVVQAEGQEYRAWDPYRSKLAASILKGLSQNPISPGSKILYLGAASGTTVSHVSDIIGPKGTVYCVEFAQRSFRDLVNNVCRDRRNTVPIFGDARFPSKYKSIVPSLEIVYCDISQPDQTRILVENTDAYLEKKGAYLLVVKSRSINVAREPADVIRSETNYLVEKGYKVEESIRLEPFEKDHAMLRGTKREE